MKRALDENGHDLKHDEEVCTLRPIDKIASKRSKVSQLLREVCPLRISAHSSEEVEIWATEVETALSSTYPTQKEFLKRSTHLISYLKSNGSQLASLSPHQLAIITTGELRELTKSDYNKYMGVKNQFKGWENSFSVLKAPLLNDGSKWHNDVKKELVFAVLSDDAFEAYSHFFGAAPRVRIVKQDIRELDNGSIDCFVSPANIYGNMDGGIDRAYAEHFEWPFGRPYGPPNPLQLKIYEVYPSHELPVGDAIVVPVERLVETNAKTDSDVTRSLVRYLIAAPTMAIPGPIETGSRIVYDAMLAVFTVWFRTDGINSIAAPPFGTGYGEVPVFVAAAQTWEAFVKAMTT